MPKQSVTLDTFHGGLNLVSAERDILDAQLIEAKDCSVDKMGQITTIGGTTDISTSTYLIDQASSTTPGHGLFHWNTDYQQIAVASIKTIIKVTATVNGDDKALLHVPSHGFSNGAVIYISGTSKYNGTWEARGVASNTMNIRVIGGSEDVQFLGNSVGTLSGTSWSNDDSFFALCDYKNSTVDIFSKAAQAWFLDEIDLGGTDPEAVYYAADGALRVSDGTFSRGSSNKWYGFIDRTLFKNSNKPSEIKGFFATPQALKRPVGKFDENQDTGTQLVSITDSQSDYTFAADKQTANIGSSALWTDAGAGNFTTRKIGRLKVGLKITAVNTYNVYALSSDLLEYRVTLRYGDSSSATAVSASTGSVYGVTSISGNATGSASHIRHASFEFPYDAGPETGFQFTGCGTTNTDTEVTHVNDSGAVKVGMKVTGDGIQAGSTVATVNSTTSFELSAAATATAIVILTFFNTGEYHTVAITSIEKGAGVQSVLIDSLEFFKATSNVTSVDVDLGALQFDYKFAVPSSGKKGSYWDTKWSIGATFLYGEGATRQESMLTYLKNVDDASSYIDGTSGTELGVFGSGDDAAEGMCPKVTLTFDYSGPYLNQQALQAGGTDNLINDTGNITSDVTATTFVVDDGSVFQANDRILIDAEVMKISGVSTHTLTVVRGDKLTTAATHANDSIIYIIRRSEWNPRVTGVKLYMKDIHSLEDKTWKPQIEYDFLDGVARVIRTGHEEDILFDDDDRYICFIDKQYMLEPNLVGNFETETGVNFDEKSVYSRYKTATIANGRAYVGNVDVKMIGQDRTVRMGDTILKTPFNKFDIFPLSNRIDVAVNDGDHIIKLENFNDRLLCFKEETLYIINISQDVEFVEGVYKHRGIQHPAQVFKTDFGIAWANRLGVFLYDGQKVTNLTEKQGQKLIDWPSQITSSMTPMVGYTPKSRQIIVFEDTSTAGFYVWIYDLDTRSWVRGTHDATNRNFDTFKTNFVINENEDLIFATAASASSGVTHYFVKWTDSPKLADALDIKTKEIDFGNPAARKKVYAVHVSYQAGSNTTAVVTLVAQTSSGYTTYTFKDGTAGGATSTLYDGQTLDSTGGVWKTAILKPSSSINNIYSAYVRIAGTDVIATFKINDISIVYRVKPVK